MTAIDWAVLWLIFASIAAYIIWTAEDSARDSQEREDRHE